MARVQTMSIFSAHADQADLLWFIGSLTPAPKTIFLVHGDPADRQAFASLLHAKGMKKIACPAYGESVEVAQDND